MTFDLDLWPTDLNINRDHLLTKDYQPTKFEASGAKLSWVISCTRWSKLAWPLTLTFDLLTWISIGIIYSPSFWGKAFLSYQLHKVKGYRHTDRPTDIPTDQHTDRQVQSNMPSFFKGGHKNVSVWGTHMSPAIPSKAKCHYHESVTIGQTEGHTDKKTTDKVIPMNRSAKHWRHNYPSRQNYTVLGQIWQWLTFCFLEISSDKILDESRTLMADSSSRIFPSEADRVCRILSSISFNAFLFWALCTIRACLSSSNSGLKNETIQGFCSLAYIAILTLTLVIFVKVKKCQCLGGFLTRMMNASTFNNTD